MGPDFVSAPKDLQDNSNSASPIVKRRRFEAPPSNTDTPTITLPTTSTATDTPTTIQPFQRKPLTDMKVLYLFAGQERKANIANMLRQRGATVLEVDIIRNPQHDLTKLEQRRYYLDLIAKKTWDVLITSPPCDTFSRAKMANTLGPSPSRSLGYPRGLPNLPKTLHLRNTLGNILADFSWDACLAQLNSNPNGMLIKEHPEDLGRVATGPFSGCSPASIWQWEQHEQCISMGAVSVGIRQFDYGTPYVKPTRLLLKLDNYKDLPDNFFPGIPIFSEDRTYLGPIPHIKGTTSLVRRNNDTGFRTTGTAAWPAKMCTVLTDLLQAAYARRVPGDTLQKAPQTQLDVDNKIPGDMENDCILPSIVIKVPGTSARDYPIHLPPENYAKGGTGDGRRISMPNRTYSFHDGLGLTSPGRFDKHQRKFPEGLRWQSLRNDIKGVLGKMDEPQIMKSLVSLALGRSDHFDEEWPKQMRQILHQWLKRQSGNYENTEQPSIAEGQPFCLGIIKGILQEGVDADFQIFDEFSKGVNLGVLLPLPRTPALFEEQTTWRLEENPFAVRREQNQNYNSLFEHVTTVREQFESDVQCGRMIKLTKQEYEASYPKEARAISALAALQEKDKVRTLTDGTHAVQVNNRMRCRDKLRSPGPREKFYLLNQFRQQKNIAFSLLGDVAQAHRLVKVRPQDWGLLACELDNPNERWLNCCGTFGFSSAAYWFARLMSGIVRMVYMILGPELPLDALLFADDLEVIAETPKERRSILVFICLLFAVGTPMKWKKFRGGFQVDWIGLHTNYRSYSLGLSEDRAAWVTRWTAQCVSDKVVDVSDFQAGVGRLNFATQALMYYRPFLGILYAWVSTIARAGVKRATLPWAVALVLKWIGDKLAGERLMEAPEPPSGKIEDWFRADAKATDTQAWIGGWESAAGSTMSAKWFALEIKKEDFGWAFAKGSPKRAIAALELLATLMCIKTFGSNHKGTKQRNCSLTASTDNLGNTFIVSKLLTTKFPSILMLLELTEELRDRKAILHLSWRSRDLNEEADALTNEDYSLFDPRLRQHIDPKNLGWKILPSLEADAQSLYDELKIIKDKKDPTSKGTAVANKFFKRSAKTRLKWKDPW